MISLHLHSATVPLSQGAILLVFCVPSSLNYCGTSLLWSQLKLVDVRTKSLLASRSNDKWFVRCCAVLVRECVEAGGVRHTVVIGGVL